ncbi:hypothetical protein ACFVXG_07725 [Kitasatospora sp. NPDC058162]|uniref:hypothetical protein n=1 Tax=Kitasatospora sp. NPDC058162 TaxID=3346362 RepID=UPI0036DF9C6A
MLITASLAGLLGLATVTLVYLKRVTLGAAIVLWVGGFTAASTGLAGPVNDLLGALLSAVNHH